MKVLTTLFIAFSFLAMMSCESDWPRKDDDITDCIKEKAEQRNDDGEQYQHVYKYVKKDGQGVTTTMIYFRFVAETGQYDEMYDRSCNLICSPQRGVYSGLTGDCAYPLFNDPQEWTLIWTNPKLK